MNECLLIPICEQQSNNIFVILLMQSSSQLISKRILFKFSNIFNNMDLFHFATWKHSAEKTRKKSKRKKNIKKHIFINTMI